jgi:nicotinate-nucleotide--dimethylbenzimidazole phosphoribosyltransferase
VQNAQLQDRLKFLINNKTKPIGALGKLEEIALQVGTILNTTSPAIKHPHIVVFAGDHGIAETGLVNPYPQAVTRQMVLNFVAGGAAINVFCKQNNIGLTVVDAGVNADFDPTLPIVQAKIAKGTRNYLAESAMSHIECEKAMEQGGSIVQTLFDQKCNCIGFGEMGIGNTSSASLIMSAVLQLPVADCVGRGTGTSEEQLKTKLDILSQVFRKHHSACASPIEILRTFGGFEIAMMTGAYLKASALQMIIVVDGFISTTALLIAHAIDASVLEYCLFAHVSGERGHQKMLQYLNATPILNMGLRLGEGTGAALAIPLIQSSVAFLNEMASFETAHVSTAK